MIEKAVPPLFHQIDSSTVWVRLQYFGNIHFAWLTGKPIYHIYITFCRSITTVLREFLKFICGNAPALIVANPLRKSWNPQHGWFMIKCDIQRSVISFPFSKGFSLFHPGGKVSKWPHGARSRPSLFRFSFW